MLAEADAQVASHRRQHRRLVVDRQDRGSPLRRLRLRSGTGECALGLG